MRGHVHCRQTGPADRFFSYGVVDQPTIWLSIHEITVFQTVFWGPGENVNSRATSVVPSGVVIVPAMLTTVAGLLPSSLT